VPENLPNMNVIGVERQKALFNREKGLEINKFVTVRAFHSELLKTMQSALKSQPKF